MMKIRLLLLLFSLGAYYISAQVSIGATEKPIEGALLQLKENAQKGANSSRGLKMPIVSLRTKTDLYPMFDDTPEQAAPTPNDSYNDGAKKTTQDGIHTGLMVFNIKDDAVFCKGLYVWSGAEWNRIPEDCLNLEVNPLSLYFYKSALASKTINVSSGPTQEPRYFSEVGNISWLPSTGFPIDGLKDATYSFQPTVNTTGNELRSVVTVTVLKGGKSVTKDVEIIQSAAEMLFNATTTTYPAAAGGYNFSVNSEAEWEILSTNNPTKSIVSSFTTSRFPKGNNQTYSFNLTGNNSFTTPRTADFNVTSPNPEFKERTVTINQAAAVPALTVNPTAIDFGVSATAQNITITTNADWNFWAPDDQWGNVISGASPAVNTIHAGGQPLTPVNKIVTLTPNTSNAAEWNTLYSTKLSTSTQNTGATNSGKTVTISRRVPYKLEAVSVTSGHTNGQVVPFQAFNITVGAWSNGPWATIVRENWGVASNLVGGYANRSGMSGWNVSHATLTIPMNMSVAARQVTIGYHDKDGGSVTPLIAINQGGVPLAFDVECGGKFWAKEDMGTMTPQGQYGATWAEASMGCANKAPIGTWRLPTAAELSPVIKDCFFMGGETTNPAAQYWTSTQGSSIMRASASVWWGSSGPVGGDSNSKAFYRCIMIH